MAIPDFAVMVAIDREHVEEFAISYPTWKRFKPALCERPFVFVLDSYDRDTHYHLFGRLIEIVGERAFQPAGNAIFCHVDQRRPHASQREKMLAGLVFDGPQRVFAMGCQYFLKLDTDTLATGCEDWIDAGWFRDDPAWIASGWHYTKPATQLDQFAAWSANHPQAFPLPMPQHEIRGNIARHRRMISYCMFGHAEWSLRMAALANNRLPISSQDGFYSLCAARSGANVRYVQMKDYGWRHVGSNIGRLRKAAAEAMQEQMT